MLHQSSGPRVFLSFSLSLPLSFLGWSPGAQRLSEFTFLPGLLRPSREGALHLHPIERVPEASVNKASPMPGALFGFLRKPRNISLFLSFTFFSLTPDHQVPVH